MDVPTASRDIALTCLRGGKAIPRGSVPTSKRMSGKDSRLLIFVSETIDRQGANVIGRHHNVMAPKPAPTKRVPPKQRWDGQKKKHPSTWVKVMEASSTSSMARGIIIGQHRPMATTAAAVAAAAAATTSRVILTSGRGSSSMGGSPRALVPIDRSPGMRTHRGVKATVPMDSSPSIRTKVDIKVTSSTPAMMTRAAEWHPTMMGTAEMTGTTEWRPETTTAAAAEAATTTTEVGAVPIHIAMIVWLVTVRVAMVVMGGSNTDQLTTLNSTLARTGVALTAVTAGQTDHMTGVHQEDLNQITTTVITPDHHDVSTMSRRTSLTKCLLR